MRVTIENQFDIFRDVFFSTRQWREFEESRPGLTAVTSKVLEMIQQKFDYDEENERWIPDVTALVGPRGVISIPYTDDVVKIKTALGQDPELLEFLVQLNKASFVCNEGQPLRIEAVGFEE